MPELRRDPVIGRWVIVSSNRGKRPIDFSIQKDMPQGGTCPFCPGFEDKTPPEILAYHHPGREKDKPGWWVRVIPNKFPALEIEGDSNRTGEGMYDKMKALGAHEIIIESPNHNEALHQMDQQKLEDVIWSYRDRILDLKKDTRLEYILIFKNHGAAAGASISHPHSQLIAIPMVPIRVRQEMEGSKSYYDYKERCVYCDILHQEISQNVRVAAINKDFVAITPFASRFPFETWIMPLRHSSEFYDIQNQEVASLTSILKLVLAKHDFVLDKPPFNMILHNAPLKTNHVNHFHWYLEIIPKLTRLAGFEQGTGFYINPTPPEEAAKLLREANVS
ncbi:MAG: galactose-1-phosphate uridylyltransferase [Elusimicrobia bacterium]|nr:galactose-1-phosphate uridylyltransferase [Candidatus Obscuribacterium magneticum]